MLHVCAKVLTSMLRCVRNGKMSKKALTRVVGIVTCGILWTCTEPICSSSRWGWQPMQRLAVSSTSSHLWEIALLVGTGRFCLELVPSSIQSGVGLRRQLYVFICRVIYALLLSECYAEWSTQILHLLNCHIVLNFPNMIFTNFQFKNV